MSIKSLATAVPRLTNIVDVLNKFPKIVTESFNADESDSPIVRYSPSIDASILDASSEIIGALLPIYKSTTALQATSPWVGIIISDKQNTTPSSRLLGCQLGALCETEMFTLDFVSNTGYTVTGFYSGSLGSGNTTSDFTSSGDGDLKIFASTNSGLFSGTFASGDTIFISANKFDRIVATCCTYKATADVLRGIFFERSINDESNLIEKLSNHGRRILNLLQKPYAEDGYRLSTLPNRDFSDWQCGNWDGVLYDHLGTPDDNEFSNDNTDTYSD